MFKVTHISPTGAFVFAAALSATSPAAAETITLLSSDGSINLTGEFIAYSAESYIIDTIHGELRVAPELVTCHGAGCPSTDTDKSDVHSSDVPADGTREDDLALVTLPQNPASSLTTQQAPADATPISYVSADEFGDTKPITLIDSCGMAIIPGGFSTPSGHAAPVQVSSMITDEAALNVAALHMVNYASSDATAGEVSNIAFTEAAIDRHSQHPDGPLGVHLIATQSSAYRTGVVTEMLSQMNGTDRLSTTFRFREGSSRLDPRGAIDQERLIAYLQAQPSGTEVTLVGFTDSLGTFRDNLRLSRLRAWQAGERITNAGAGLLDHVTITTLGFGEIAPAACNDDAEGRRINRRVEVWIKSHV